jgi:hypothetical protein
MVKRGVGMENEPMIFFDKRFRSKALSAASLPPGQVGNRRRNAFDFLSDSYCNGVSVWEVCLGE